MRTLHRQMLLFVVLLMCFTCSYASDTTKIAVQFKSGKHTLHGDLVLPKVNHKVPVVVFLVGSGGNSSYKTTYKEWCKENLENLLLPAGIGILYFDKRGVGASVGKWHKTDFDQRAQDAKAAIDFLKQQPGVDSSNIGIAGHSQGGWIAQLVASRYPNDIAFGISLAGASFGVRKQLLNDYIGELLCKQIDPAEAQQKAALHTQKTLTMAAFMPLKKESKQLKRIKDFEPAGAIRGIQVPFLFLFAENDALVNPEWSIRDLRDIFPEGIPAHIEFQIIPEANHTFRTAPFCYDGPWDDMPYSVEYQQSFSSWIMHQLQEKNKPVLSSK